MLYYPTGGSSRNGAATTYSRKYMVAHDAKIVLRNFSVKVGEKVSLAPLSHMVVRSIHEQPV